MDSNPNYPTEIRLPDGRAFIAVAALIHSRERRDADHLGVPRLCTLIPDLEEFKTRAQGGEELFVAYVEKDFLAGCIKEAKDGPLASG